jgi:hypothetical protein
MSRNCIPELQSEEWNSVKLLSDSHLFQYTVITKASPVVAWRVFSDWNRWPAFANVYGSLRWHEGKPWEVGSRLFIELLRPVSAVIDHVIITCAPAKKIGWIDNALGVTIIQWVEFEQQAHDRTVVHTWGEIAGAKLLVAGRTVEQLVNTFTETWYENFRAACDERVRAGDGFAETV